VPPVGELRVARGFLIPPVEAVHLVRVYGDAVALAAGARVWRRRTSSRGGDAVEPAAGG
jgi:hypothetical protein